MNILQLVSNKVWGGGERYALDLSRTLHADGHHVEVFTRRREAVAAPFATLGLHAGYLRLGGMLDFISPVSLARRLDRLDGRTIIHVHNFKDAYTALAARRLCRRRHDIRVVCTRHLVRPARRDRLHLDIVAGLDAIIFVSQLARDVFTAALPAGTDTSHMHVLHNSIPSPVAEAVAPPHGSDIELLYLGRIDPEKGLDTLLHALAHTPPHIHLTIAGTGTGRDVMPLMSLARSLDIDDRVSWPGHVNDVADAIDRADAVVLPSRAREACPMVIVEAFSRGRAVITTDAGAQRELVTDRHDGLIVPADDFRALADALSRLDAQLIDRMGNAALDSFTRRMTYPIFYSSILDIYNGC